jgi:inosine-uridine nucleoside N-ribohydrolase
MLRVVLQSIRWWVITTANQVCCSVMHHYLLHTASHLTNTASSFLFHLSCTGILVHGENGRGNVASPIAKPNAAPADHKHESAAQYMVDQCKAAPGQITICTLGPMTNLALAVKLGGEAFIK